MKKSFLFIFISLLTCACVIFLSTPDLSVEKITDISQTLTVFDKDNQVSAVFNSGQNREKVKLEDVPQSVLDALLATEDIRFYQHNGIDVKRIFGAMVADIKSGTLKEGASTITQQLIKNSHLTNEKTFMRKINEAILALQLERQYEKDEILEMYLNFVYFGRGAYGILTASKAYFGKTLNELTVSEGAMLIGLLKAPNKYAPHINMENAIKRRNTVLSQMAKYGFITEKEAQEYSAQEIKIIEKEERADFGYFTDYVLEQGADILGVSVSDLMGSGYKIYTTLDSDLQASVQKIYEDDENFPKTSEGIVQSASVVIDNETGAISALIGGREHTGMRVFNRATAKRQPGSCIKPILVYAPAFERDAITCATVLDDFRKDFDGYSPTNFKEVYYGKTTVRKALSLSLNVPAVDLLNKNGIEYSKSVAQKLGITFDESDKYLALALGGMKYGVSAVDLAGAYRTFATGGKYVDSWCIREIRDEENNVIYKHQAVEEQAIRETTAFLLTDILCDVSKQKSNALSKFKQEIACKTGTVGYCDVGYSDAWSTAYVKSHTLCVWMGFDRTEREQYLDEAITGSSYPSLIASKIFEKIFSVYGYEEFSVPENIVKKEIDSFSLKKSSEIFLAGKYTGKNNIISEYFTKETAPKASSEYWDRPFAPSEVAVQLNELRQCEISFTALQEHVNYRVYRVRGEETTHVATLSGKKGENLFLTDKGYTFGDGYYILPVHKLIFDNGSLLEGEKTDIYYLS